MDVDVCAVGGVGLPRPASGEGVQEIVPLELYDSARAKIDANLRWLLAKAYGIDHIPADLRDPFYRDQYSVEHIKPPVLSLLLSAELYCRVAGLLLLRGDQAAQWGDQAELTSHQAVLQALGRRGIHVQQPDHTPVSHHSLSHTPINMSSHIPMVDALMLLYTVEMMSIERVVSCVKRFSTFSSSKELPFSTEDAMLFWINKVILKARDLSEKELKLKQHLLDSPCHQKPDSMHTLAQCLVEPTELSCVVRYRREQLLGRLLPHLPVLEDLMKDVCDGAALLTVIHYYCPQHLRLEDICLKEVPSIADSLYNIQLLRDFSTQYLNRCFYLCSEDLLYSPPELKHNVMVFIAELFWWFEIVNPDFVQPRDLQDIKDVRATLQPKSARPDVPISNATKRSFLSTPTSADTMATAQSQDTCNRYYLHPEDSASVTKGSSASVPSHSLLPLRQRQQKSVQGEETAELRNRSNSLSRMDGHTPGSRLAWAERRQRPLSQLFPGDAEWERVCGDSVSLARSISKDSLASNVLTATPRHRLNGLPLLPTRGDHDEEEEEEEEEELVAIVGRVQDESRPPESFFLEPLQPALLRPAKEKSISLSKQEESGEGTHTHAHTHTCTDRTGPSEQEASGEGRVRGESLPPSQTFAPIHSRTEQTAGFFLHDDTPPFSSCVRSSPFSAWEGVDSDSDLAELEDEEDEEAGGELQLVGRRGPGEEEEEEEESAKLREEVHVRERDDKEGASVQSSGRGSPSTLSQASSTSSTTGRMTSFAERRLHHRAILPDYGGHYSAGSSQKSTPDGSESAPLPPPALAIELLHLRMRLEEKRRAIEKQKRKMETLSARQRLRLGKAAFLNVVRRGGKSDTLPLPLKQEPGARDRPGAKDDACTEALRGRGKQGKNSPAPPAGLEGDNRGQSGEGGGGEPDLSECSRSIELLNEAISAIQQQMLQMSLQQDLLIKAQSPPELQQDLLIKAQSPPELQQDLPVKHRAQSPPEPFFKHRAQSPSDRASEPKPRPPVHFMETIATATRRPPRLSSSRSSARAKPADLKLPKGSKGSSHPSPNADPLPPSSKQSQVAHPPCTEPEEEGVGGGREGGRSLARNTTFRLHDGANRRCSPETPMPDPPAVDPPCVDRPVPDPPCVEPRQRSSSGSSGKENVPCEESGRAKASLIEVDLSDLADTSTDQDAEQKSGLGFFFKDDQKAEDELAKKRMAFLLKQQRKAEETRLRRQQQEAESELKRDEARRKAEEERVRKEEEKVRRELIKQEYLRRKQQELLEEQGVAKPRPKARRPRPKSLHRGQSCSSATSSSLSLASAATEADSFTSGGTGSQRGDSVESFPLLSRNGSRNLEREWDNGSTASSITSVAEYSGPRLFKEPSAKSNKPIIHNAIAHCCLAGRVNEAQKNSILEELERCEANHLMILFRDGGCQFRALYSFLPDTEEILKVTGAGPKVVSKKMVDKLFKYNSDRKQFTCIPAKSVSVSVDAITIHSHLWHVKRPSSTKRK